MYAIKKAFCCSVSAVILCGGSDTVYASALDVSPDRHTTFTTELESTDAYQIASAVFLPDTADDLGMSGRHFKAGYYSTNENCNGYTLTICPDGWTCYECKTTGLQTKYQKAGCASPYISDGKDGCKCPPAVPFDVSKNILCTKWCGSICIAAENKCVPQNDTAQSCTRGKTTCPDGCGGTRQCCNACTDTYNGSLPKNAHYQYQSCIDDDGIKNIKSGWTCDDGYKKTASEDSCIKDIPKTECSAGQVDLDNYWCGDALKCWWK